MSSYDTDRAVRRDWAAHARTRVAAVALLALVNAGIAVGAAPLHEHYHKTAAFKRKSPDGAHAPRLLNVGKGEFPVTTRSAEAQRFINQGLNLAYGFNHAEAGRAFAEAARLDPDCAMAWWGQALVLGPNINAPMDPDSERLAHRYMRKAVGLRKKVSPREQAYIDALAVRYTGNPADRIAADQAYAGAMRELQENHPDDLDAATLYAEALMDLRPWDYWTPDGRPRERTTDVIAALNGVVTRNPHHAGALHLWLHLWEPSTTPERAESAADRLVGLAGSAGHLIHMPGHIFQRVGRYADAVSANQLAIKADEDYITQCRAQGFYPLAYYPHNVHFLWFAATMAGQSQLALEAARKTAETITADAVKSMPMLQSFLLIPDFAYVRFGQWDAILAQSPPRISTPYVRGVRHYARAMAFIRKKDFVSAASEIDHLARIAADPELVRTPTSWTPNGADAVLRVALLAVQGERAAAEGRYDEAIAHLDTAVRFHDSFAYAEPDDWHQPMRQILGAVLLEAGRAAEAEAVFWEDLRRNPRNGWSFFGLSKALQAQGKTSEAQAVEAEFRREWASADVTLHAARF